MKIYVVIGFPHMDIDGVGAENIRARTPELAARKYIKDSFDSEPIFTVLGSGAGVHRFEATDASPEHEGCCAWTILVMDMA